MQNSLETAYPISKPVSQQDPAKAVQTYWGAAYLVEPELTIRALMCQLHCRQPYLITCKMRCVGSRYYLGYPRPGEKEAWALYTNPPVTAQIGALRPGPKSTYADRSA